MSKLNVQTGLIAWIVCMVLASGYFLWQDFRSDVPPAGGAPVELAGAAPAPEQIIFQLPGLDGKMVTVGGRYVVVNFWATWCPPCRGELPEMVRFAEYAAQKNIPFYAVDIQEKPAEVAGFLRSKGYQLPVLMDANGQVARQYRISAIPTTLILDARGSIVFRKTGTTTYKEMKEAVERL